MIDILLILLGCALAIAVCCVSISLFLNWISFNTSKVGDNVFQSVEFVNNSYGLKTFDIVPFKIVDIKRKNKFIIEYMVLENGVIIKSFLELIRNVQHVHDNDKWYEYLYR